MLQEPAERRRGAGVPSTVPPGRVHRPWHPFSRRQLLPQHRYPHHRRPTTRGGSFHRISHRSPQPRTASTACFWREADVTRGRPWRGRVPSGHRRPARAEELPTLVHPSGQDRVRDVLRFRFPSVALATVSGGVNRCRPVFSPQASPHSWERTAGLQSGMTAPETRVSCRQTTALPGAPTGPAGGPGTPVRTRSAWLPSVSTTVRAVSLVAAPGNAAAGSGQQRRRQDGAWREPIVSWRERRPSPKPSPPHRSPPARPDSPILHHAERSRPNRDCPRTRQGSRRRPHARPDR